MTSRHRTAVAAATLAAAASLLGGLQPASAELAPFAVAGPIHPGVQTVTGGSQCTANFIFQDSSGTKYIGQAAHCSSTGTATQTNGCTTGTLAVGASVSIGGAPHAGTMVYNSWATMQGIPETNGNTCAYNDFALVQIDSRDNALVDSSVPFWGGPRGVRTAGLSTGDDVVTFGNSSLRAGLIYLSPKQGVSLGDGGGGWTHSVYTASQGIPGDSGSGFLDANGDAFGVLSTIGLAPVPGANGVGDLNKEIAYMHAHSTFTTVNLVAGTKPFRGPLP